MSLLAAGRRRHGGRQHRRTGGIRVTQKVLAGMTMTLDGMEKIP